MPEMDGLDILAVLQREAILVATILITGRLEAAIAERAGKLGVIAILEKPLAVARLVELLRAGPEKLPPV